MYLNEHLQCHEYTWIWNLLWIHVDLCIRTSTYNEQCINIHECVIMYKCTWICNLLSIHVDLCIETSTYNEQCEQMRGSEVANARYSTISRLLKIIGLFGKRALQKRWYSAKETYNCKEPTTHSHPICVQCLIHMYLRMGWLRLVGSLQL